MHLLLILRREHVREVGLPVTLEELGAGKVTSQNMKIQISQISADSSVLCLQQLLQSLPEMVSWHVPYSAAMRIKYC